MNTAPAAVRDTLLQQTTLCDTQMLVHLKQSIDSLVGVRRDVYGELSLKDLVSVLPADVEVVRV